jgi:sulfofructose kinase
MSGSPSGPPGRGAGVVVIGHSAADLVARVDRYPPANGRVRTKSAIRRLGGEAAVAAATLARLGVATAIVTKVGSDEEGRFVLREYERAGVDTSRVSIEPGHRTLSAFVVVEEATASRTIFWHDELDPIRPEELDFEGIGSAAALLCDQHEAAAAAAALAHASARGVPTVLDVDDLNDETIPLIRQVGTLIGSEGFARHVSDRVDAAVEEIAAMGPHRAVITLGERGCLVREDGETRCFPAFAVRATDTTGAGDVFHGAFTYGVVKRWPTARTAVFANAAAALKCSRREGEPDVPALSEVLALAGAAR